MGRLAMLIKLLMVSLVFSSCGREVTFKNNKLESLQQITEADAKRYQLSGSITKTADAASLTYQGKSYRVSTYSSKSAQEFIAAMVIGAQIPILFTGGMSGDMVDIQSIKRQ
jgi:hypothetical protein